eukprot:1159832-Pelagomonas_calceolata.AAC.15
MDSVFWGSGLYDMVKPLPAIVNSSQRYQQSRASAFCTRLWTLAVEKSPKNRALNIPDCAFPNGTGPSAQRQTRPDDVFAYPNQGRATHLKPEMIPTHDRDIHLVELKCCPDTIPSTILKKAADQHAIHKALPEKEQFRYLGMLVPQVVDKHMNLKVSEEHAVRPYMAAQQRIKESSCTWHSKILIASLSHTELKTWNILHLRRT